jgi:6-phosphofructokinase
MSSSQKSSTSSLIPKRVALLTGGGDAPGLNGIVEATARALILQGVRVFGIRDGFEGIFGEHWFEIQLDQLEGLHGQAGTFLGTSNRSRVEGREKEFLEKYKKLGVEGIVVAGGDGTFAALQSLGGQVALMGVPKTIDNDLSGTEITFGYDTACSVVAESIDALRATADAHRRVMIVEAMGRTAGWIALGGGLASMSDAILIPERPFQRGELIEYIKKKKSEGRRGLMIVVSEGAHAAGEDPSVAFRVEDSPQAERFGGLAERLARYIESQVDWECRHVVLGHLQRAQHPTTTDRFLTISMGVEVARLVLESKWGQAVVYREGRIQRAPITDLQKAPKLVDPDHRWVKLAQALGIFI